MEDIINTALITITTDNNELHVGETITLFEGAIGGTVIYQGIIKNTKDPVVYVPENGDYLVLTNNPDRYKANELYQLDNRPLVLCFARGTLITTPEGEKAVEDLHIGDLVLTADGQTAPVKWIGRQTRHPLFTELPVCIRAGALGV